MSVTNIFTAGEALTVEMLNVMAELARFVHDFEFQTSVTFDDQRFIVPFPCTIKQIHAKFKTAPTGSDAIFNIKRNGTDLWSSSDRPTLAAGSTTLNKVDCDEDLEEGDYIEWVDVQAGSTTAGGYGVIRIYARA